MNASLEQQLYEIWMRGSGRLLGWAAGLAVAAVLTFVVLGLILPEGNHEGGVHRALELVRLYAALGLLAGAAIFVGQYLMQRSSALDRLALLNQGRPTMGRVTGKGPGHELEYTFTDERGQNHRGHAEVAPRWLERWTVGQDILVVFDPREPARHMADLFGFRATDLAKMKDRRS